MDKDGHGHGLGHGFAWIWEWTWIWMDMDLDIDGHKPNRGRWFSWAWNQQDSLCHSTKIAPSVPVCCTHQLKQSGKSPKSAQMWICMPHYVFFCQTFRINYLIQFHQIFRSDIYMSMYLHIIINQADFEQYLPTVFFILSSIEQLLFTYNWTSRTCIQTKNCEIIQLSTKSKFVDLRKRLLQKINQSKNYAKLRDANLGNRS